MWNKCPFNFLGNEDKNAPIIKDIDSIIAHLPNDLALLIINYCPTVFPTFVGNTPKIPLFVSHKLDDRNNICCYPQCPFVLSGRNKNNNIIFCYDGIK